MVAPDSSRIKAVIKEFLADPNLTDEQDLNHMVDSLDLLDLVLSVELEFSISIFSEEITLKNFQTINSIASFVSSKILEASVV